jgi:hypothetical protein
MPTGDRARLPRVEQHRQVTLWQVCCMDENHVALFVPMFLLCRLVVVCMGTFFNIFFTADTARTTWDKKNWEHSTNIAMQFYHFLCFLIRFTWEQKVTFSYFSYFLMSCTKRKYLCGFSVNLFWNVLWNTVVPLVHNFLLYVFHTSYCMFSISSVITVEQQLIIQ